MFIFCKKSVHLCLLWFHKWFHSYIYKSWLFLYSVMESFILLITMMILSFNTHASIWLLLHTFIQIFVNSTIFTTADDDFTNLITNWLWWATFTLPLNYIFDLLSASTFRNHMLKLLLALIFGISIPAMYKVTKSAA